jgi:molybdopterin-biosynthesis enzyme MoeA-like protein
VVEARGSRIVSLPGVPAELKAIVEGPLRGLLGEIFGRGSYREREIMVECNDESQLAPTLRRVAASNPDVYIKSRATRFGPDVRFRVILSASATSTEKADALIEQASVDLASALRSLLPQA